LLLTCQKSLLVDFETLSHSLFWRN